MPAKTEKQKKFFGDKKATKKVAKDSPETENEEDEQSVSKQLKKSGKATFKGPEVKQRKKFAPATKVESPKKGAGSYDRKDKKDTLKENTDIINFIECIMQKNYTSANKYLNTAVELKIQKVIESELDTPLF